MAFRMIRVQQIEGLLLRGFGAVLGDEDLIAAGVDEYLLFADIARPSASGSIQRAKSSGNRPMVKGLAEPS